jgi:hypothetical protein
MMQSTPPLKRCDEHPRCHHAVLREDQLGIHPTRTAFAYPVTPHTQLPQFEDFPLRLKS